MKGKAFLTTLVSLLCLAALLVPVAGARDRPEPAAVSGGASASTTLPASLASYTLPASVGRMQGAPRVASYNAVEDVGQVVTYVPSVFKEYYGWNSLLSIQNLTGATMFITVEFFEGSPTPIHQESHNVPAYSPWNLNLADVGGLPSGWYGSAAVSAPGPMAVAVLEEEVAVGELTAYDGFYSAAPELFVPALYNGYYGWDSALLVQNVASAPATVLVSYSDGITNGAVLGPNETYLFYQPAEGHAQGATFSAHVVAGQPLVAFSRYNDISGNITSQEAFLWGGNEVTVPLTAKCTCPFGAL